MLARERSPRHAEELVAAAGAAIHAVVLDDLPRLKRLRRHARGLHAARILRNAGQLAAARDSGAVGRATDNLTQSVERSMKDCSYDCGDAGCDGGVATSSSSRAASTPSAAQAAARSPA